MSTPSVPPKNKRIITVYVDYKYLLPSSASKLHRELKEKNIGEFMNFDTMVEKAREGKHLRRKSWPESMRLWSDGKILIHNTPYFGEPFNQAIQGYVYVTEQVDVVADDWEIAG